MWPALKVSRTHCEVPLKPMLKSTRLDHAGCVSFEVDDRWPLSANYHKCFTSNKASLNIGSPAFRRATAIPRQNAPKMHRISSVNLGAPAERHYDLCGSLRPVLGRQLVNALVMASLRNPTIMYCTMNMHQVSISTSKSIKNTRPSLHSLAIQPRMWKYGRQCVRETLSKNQMCINDLKSPTIQ